MVQIYILGSSSAYGVGSSIAGWGDLVKQYMHTKMYGENGVGEKYEVYNFGKSGATIDFVQETFPHQLEQYGRGGKVIVIACVGGNNSKAEDRPDNFVSTIEEYEVEVEKLLDTLQSKCSAVMLVGNGFLDESKTNPKPNPLTGGKSYMTNKRRMEFRGKNKELCEARGVPFIESQVTKDEWLKNYIYEDGLHPNQAGHQLIFSLIKEQLDEVI